jgi:predicted porin
LVVESSPEDRFNLAEASILLSGSHGRLEVGQRQGLPDVLTGYAPNNFAFTGAEFGPASGPSLDPGGGLQHAFLPSILASQLNELGSLGAFASLAGDRSAKFVYVSPKRGGFLGGFSYAPDSDDPRFGALAQGGLVHERYWDSNILRIGGSVTYAQPRGFGSALRSDLRSFNAGATFIVDDDLMLGISATWNGSSGIEKFDGSSHSSAYGATASVNYNHGPWTAGGYLQWARAEGDVRARGDDRLAAAEVGVSYRFTQKLRLYGAWYRFDFDDEGGMTTADRSTGDVLLLGVRATL